MPPPLALLLCTALVMFLLHVERRASRGVSTALWIPTLWMLMTASRSLGAWFSITEGNGAGNWLDQVVLSSLTVAAIVVLAHRRFDWLRALRRHRWLLALLAYMFLSTLWSDITLVALKRWVREVTVVVMVLVIMSEANAQQAVASALRRTAYVLLPFSLFLIRYYPALGRQYGRWSGIEMWTGVASQKNSLGRLCMISVFFLTWALYQRWRQRRSLGGSRQGLADAFVILLALYLLIGSDSATSLATLVAGLAVFLTLYFFGERNVVVPQAGLLALVVFLLGFGVAAPFVGGSNVAAFSSSLGRDETLTGRTEIWAALVPVMQQQPLLGYGFASFWTDARRGLYEIPTAHNGYLDILLDQGVIGLALYMVWLLSCARRFHRALARDYDWATLGICFLLMSLVYNVSESALNSLTEHMTAMIVLTSFIVAARFSPKHVATAAVRVNPNAPSLQLEGQGIHTCWHW